jgi:hypothetical protein
MTLGALQQLAVDADVITRWICFGAQLHHHFAVDLDTAAEDQLFGFAARRDTGLGQNLLQAFQLGFRTFGRGREILLGFLFRNIGRVAQNFGDFFCAGRIYDQIAAFVGLGYGLCLLRLGLRLDGRFLLLHGWLCFGCCFLCSFWSFWGADRFCCWGRIGNRLVRFLLASLGFGLNFSR